MKVNSSTESAQFNALRHGVLSRYTVLPWRDAAEYQPWSRPLSPSTLRKDRPRSIWLRNWSAFFGASAGSVWLRRLPIDAGWTHARALRKTAKVALVHLDDLGASVDRLTPFAPLPRIPRRTSRFAGRRGDDAPRSRVAVLAAAMTLYEAALAALREDTRDWWSDTLAEILTIGRRTKNRSPPTPRACAVPGGRMLPWFEDRKKELDNRPLIREQAFGESLDPDKLERLGRYEVHLDRKLERMLAMLLRLKDLRQGAVEG